MGKRTSCICSCRSVSADVGVGLKVTRVHVREFRNYQEFVLEPDPSLTVLVGPNAVGKTNLMEAIQLLTEASSFRNPAWGDTVRQGQPVAHLSLDAEGEGRRLQTGLEITAAGRRTYRVNGKVRRAVSQVAGVLPCVMFTPDDLRLLKDSADRRRGALDSLGSQLSPTYARLKVDYDRVLRQRNAALKATDTGAPDMDSWTEQLVGLGARLTDSRRRLFGKVEKALERIYPELTAGQPIACRYVPSWERDGVDGGTADSAEALGRHLAARKEAEAARRQTLSGPHRDEMVFEIEGRDARTFASQGQQRTIALAWKLAEVEVVSEVAAQRPVLLLDDVMSELDEQRRHALAAFAGDAAQTFMTTTNLGYFEPELLGRAKVVSLP